MEGLAKIAEPQSFKELYQQSLRDGYAKKYQLDPSELTEEKMDEIRHDEQKKGLERSVGMMGAGGAAALGHKAYREGLLTGRRTFYHNTDKENVNSIKAHGLQAARAADFDNWTHQSLRDAVLMGNIDPKDLYNKVYLANSPEAALDVGLATQRDPNFPNPVEELIENFKNRKNVKVQIPLDEVDKLNIVENPEMRGAKSGLEFHRKMNEFKDQLEQVPGNWRTYPRSLFQDVMGFRSLGKGTTTVEGDIPSQFIKGGEGFNPLTAKEVFQHIKNRPGTFAKGVGLGAGALGLAGAGAHMIHDGLQKKDYHEEA